MVVMNGYFNDDMSLLGKYMNGPRAISVTSVNASDLGTLTRQQFRPNDPKAQYYTILFRGYFQAPATGNYQFLLNSDDSAYVWLPKTKGEEDFSTAIIKNPGIHGDEKLVISQPIWLNKDEVRPFIVLYGQGFGGSNLRLAWTGPGMVPPTNNFEGVWFYDREELSAIQNGLR